MLFITQIVYSNDFNVSIYREQGLITYKQLQL